MGKHRISIQELAEILIDNISELKGIGKSLERVSNKFSKDINDVVNTNIKIDLSELNKMQNSFLSSNNKLLNEVKNLKKKSINRPSTNLLFIVLGYGLVFLFISLYLFNSKNKKELEYEVLKKHNNFYLRIIHKIPNKQKDKLVKIVNSEMNQKRIKLK